MAKRPPKMPTITELTKALLDDYTRWKHIYDNGCSDPGYSDGVNIDLKRNHIIYDKHRIEVLLGDQFWAYPDLYFAPTPPKLPYNFMAKDRAYHGFKGNTDVCPANKTLTYEEVMKFGRIIES